MFFKKSSEALFEIRIYKKQGRIHGNAVADDWAGAVMQKPLVIQKCYGRTDGRMDGRTDGRMDGRMDGRTDGWTDGRTDGWTDGRTKMHACVHKEVVSASS